MTNDAESTAPVPERRRWFDLSQETFAIVGSAIALATLILTATGNIRDEARAAREAWEAEARQIRAENLANREAWERRIAEVDAAWKAETRQLRDENRAAQEAWEAESRQLRDKNRAAREAWEAESRQIRAEIQSNREAWEAESRHFQSEILRLTAETARLADRDRDTTAEPERPTAGSTATTEPATVDRDRSRPGMTRPGGPLRPS